VTLAAAGILVALTAGAVPTAGAVTDTSSGTAGASTTTSTTPAQGKISAAEAQVATIEAQISAQQQALSAADEAYNQAVVNLTATQSALSTTTASLAAARAKLDTSRATLRNDVIQAYTSGSSDDAVAALFAAPTGGDQTRTLYERLSIGNLSAEVAAVQSRQRQLTSTESKLRGEQRSETAQLADENKLRQSAASASALSEATLTQVQGTLAQEIAQQAAAQAAAAAQTAASATTPAARQVAAAQASQAAQVASTVSGGSAAATSANRAANQAAGAGGTGPGPGGGTAIASGGSPTAAGLAAVHGAMQYLGVPYVWGGASSAGVDCSGLTMLAWAAAGVSLTHSAADQYASFPHVSLTSLEPGDLLFYDLSGTGIDHVVMYVGPTLDGQSTAYGFDTIIQAAHTGTVVTFDPLWYFGLVGAARP
jgi:peptidoglycan DL-endopeptidase CwlO